MDAEIISLGNEYKEQYPITVEKAVYDDGGNRLDNKMAAMVDDVTNIKQDLTALEDRFFIFDTTTPSTAKSWVKLCDLPNGLTYDNCMILSAYYKNNYGEKIMPTKEGLELHIETNNSIDIYCALASRPLTILFYKMT